MDGRGGSADWLCGLCENYENNIENAANAAGSAVFFLCLICPVWPQRSRHRYNQTVSPAVFSAPGKTRAQPPRRIPIVVARGLLFSRRSLDGLPRSPFRAGTESWRGLRCQRFRRLPHGFDKSQPRHRRDKHAITCGNCLLVARLWALPLRPRQPWQPSCPRTPARRSGCCLSPGIP